MAAFLSGKSYAPYDLDDSGVAISSSQYFYEDKERYIIVAGDWGTLTGQFDITYLSKPWAASHIVSEAALIARLTDANSYASGLVILPEDASLAQVLRAIGDRELAWERKAGDYYYFFGEYAGESSDCVLVDLTPANAAFAVTVQYQEGEGLNTFEEDLLKKLEKKYKKLKDTPGEVINFIGYSTSFDTDFETAENYIHFGFAPHFATQHELTIINKKELAKYAKVAAEAEKIDKEKRKERDMEVREESSKF